METANGVAFNVISKKLARSRGLVIETNALSVIYIPPEAVAHQFWFSGEAEERLLV